MKKLYAVLPSKQYAATSPGIVFGSKEGYVEIAKKTNLLFPAAKPVQPTNEVVQNMLKDARSSTQPLICFETAEEAKAYADMLETLAYRGKSAQIVANPIFTIEVDEEHAKTLITQDLNTQATRHSKNQSKEIKNANFYQIQADKVAEIHTVMFNGKSVYSTEAQSMCLVM